MQKLMTISLLALYVFVSIGIHGVSQFCGDEFIGVALFKDEEVMDCGEDSCCTVPEDEPECCTDVQFSLFYESERTLALIPGRFIIKSAALALAPFFTLDIQNIPDEKWKPDSIADPSDTSSTPLYLKHQSLIFYG